MGCILVRLRTTKSMEQEWYFTTMGSCMRAVLLVIWRKVKGMRSFQMGQNIKDTSKEESSTERAFLSGAMERCMRGSGSMARNMVVEYGKALRVRVILESGTTARHKVLAYIFQNWATGTRDNSTIHKNTVSALSATTTVRPMWGNTAATAPTARANTSGLTAITIKGNLLTT